LALAAKIVPRSALLRFVTSQSFLGVFSLFGLLCSLAIFAAICLR
jgi:hypothetical protein